MIVVATRQSASPRRKASIVASSSPSSIWPCASAKRTAGQSARRRSATSCRVSIRLWRKKAWPLAPRLALDRPPDELLVVGADVGADRAPALGRRLDHRDVAQAGERHLQRARDRRRRHREHVDLQLQLAQQLLLLDAEALLLVDDHQAEVLRRGRRARAAGGCRSGCPPCRRRSGRARRAPRPACAAARPSRSRTGTSAQALAEGAEVLLGEDRRRDQHHHLLALGGGLVRGAQRDLGLAVADVAADQPVHRPLGLHVGLDRLDRVELVGGLAVGEGSLELELPLAVGRERVAPARLALGVEVEQLAGELLRPRGARAT